MRTYLILAVALHLAATSLALAQTATGVIRGRVQDTTGAVITDVHVTLVDERRNHSWDQTTNSEGFFEFRALPFGDYRLQLERPGFKKEAITDVGLEVAQTVTLNVTLQLGSLAASIRVQADRGLLEASDASLSQVIDDKRLLALPMNGSNFMQLISLSAGVINAGRASATQRQANYGPAFSVGGQRDNTSVVLIDGMEISGQELNNYPLAIPSLDSLAEFRVQTANYPAEFGGNSGAVINVVSKRGSNDFHSTRLCRDLVDVVAENGMERTGFAFHGDVKRRRRTETEPIRNPHRRECAQVARAYQRRLDERVNERMRIARELHDTLLQSFHGLLLRFQTASYLLLEHPADAKEKLDGAIQHAAQAITEGRDAVQSLRASTVERNDLALAIRTLGEELASNPSAHQAPSFSVAVEGETQDLHPIARDEIYKVVAEALRNAYRHAHASRVEVEIRYDKQQFRLRVRDDGKGIDPPGERAPPPPRVFRTARI